MFFPNIDFPTVLYSLVFTLPVILISITIHEYAHGLAATWMGDPTPKESGRLTLNPIDHVDILGLICLVLFRFGWAKPVPINPRYFKDQRKGEALVSLAGPLSNFTFAFLLSLIPKFLTPFIGPLGIIIDVVVDYAVWINLALGVFNLIPVPPLDGSHILAYFFPQYDEVIYSMNRYGLIILLVLLWFPGTLHLLFAIVRLLYKILM